MGAVQNAMTRDGLDPSIMDLDHNKSVSSQMKVDEENDSDPPLKEDPKVHMWCITYVLFFLMSSS